MSAQNKDVDFYNDVRKLFDEHTLLAKKYEEILKILQGSSIVVDSVGKKQKKVVTRSGRGGGLTFEQIVKEILRDGIAKSTSEIGSMLTINYGKNIPPKNVSSQLALLKKKGKINSASIPGNKTNYKQLWGLIEWFVNGELTREHIMIRDADTLL